MPHPDFFFFFGGGVAPCPPASSVYGPMMISDEGNKEETFHRDTMPYSFQHVAHDLFNSHKDTAGHSKAFD